MTRTRIKICGLVREEDARAARKFGADYVGFVLAPSRRRAEPRELASWLPALRREDPALLTVAVFARAGLDEIERALDLVTFDLVQLHLPWPGDPRESLWPWARKRGVEVIATTVSSAMRGEPEARPFAWLIDTPASEPSAAGEASGGSGRTHDWSLIPPAPREYRMVLAGGLAPDNVGSAIRRVRPFAVDAASRLEASAGIKDHALLEKFCDEVRRADQALREEELDV